MKTFITTIETVVADADSYINADYLQKHLTAICNNKYVSGTEIKVINTKQKVCCYDCKQWRSHFTTQCRNCYKKGIDILGNTIACDEVELRNKL